MDLDYKGGGIEALLDCINGRDINSRIVSDKSLGAIRVYAMKLMEYDLEKRVPTLGIENFFVVDHPDRKEKYFEMLGHFKVEDYPIYSDAIPEMKFQDSKSNMFMLWRLYTLVRISQFLDARYKRKTKSFVSRSLLAGLCNCTENSVGAIVNEFSRSGKKHAQLFIRMEQDHAERDVYGAMHYSLTRVPPIEFTTGVRVALREYAPVLHAYDDYLKYSIDLINRRPGLITHAKPVQKHKRSGKSYWVHKANISGKENKRAVRLIWADRFNEK